LLVFKKPKNIREEMSLKKIRRDEVVISMRINK